MKTFFASGLMALAAISLISCGGDGGTKTFSSTAQGLQNLERFTLSSMGHSGFAFSDIATGESIVSLGGFVRDLSRMFPIERTGTEIYFDDSLRLWVENQRKEGTLVSTFYLDQAKSQPAGTLTTTFGDPASDYVHGYACKYSFSAGPLSGEHGTYACTLSNASAGSMTYRNEFADGSHDDGSCTWADTGEVWQSRWEGPKDSGWIQDNAIWTVAGELSYDCSSSDGTSASWSMDGDAGTTAHIEGSDPKFPADLTWNQEALQKATYADTSTEEWGWQDVWIGGGFGYVAPGSGAGILAPGPAKPADQDKKVADPVK